MVAVAVWNDTSEREDASSSSSSPISASLSSSSLEPKLDPDPEHVEGLDALECVHPFEWLDTVPVRVDEGDETLYEDGEDISVGDN